MRQSLVRHDAARWSEGAVGVSHRMGMQNRYYSLREPRSPHPLVRALGGASVTVLMVALCELSNLSIAAVPFVTSIFMVFGSPASPHAQPVNIVGGHIGSAVVTLFFVSAFGYQPWVIAPAVGLCLLLMILMRTLHPPAGMTVMSIVTSRADWAYVAVPIALGAVFLFAYAFAFFRIVAANHWPSARPSWDRP